jgi:tRNA1(Val) A37 N6-methylase TrmN6
MKYFDALKIYNERFNNGSWCLYKKGSVEYNNIVKIMKGITDNSPIINNDKAVVIQTAIRNKIAREKIKTIKDDIKKSAAIIKIQSAIRNKKAYNYTNNLYRYIGKGNKLIDFNDNPNTLSANDYVEYKNNLKVDIDKYLPVYIRKLSFEQLLSVLDYNRQDIKALNIFLTPITNVETLLNYSYYYNINDKKLDILEPTAGTGNIIRGLIKNDNFNNFKVDAIEPVKALYHIGKNIFKNYRNVNWFNMSFFDYKPNKKYDLIVMNPPFNININGKRILDIDFVNYAYSLLKEDGRIAGIISAAFLQKNNLKNKKYKSFNDNIEQISSIYDLDEGFYTDNTTIKEMQTKQKMVYIIIDKDENVPTLIN